MWLILLACFTPSLASSDSWGSTIQRGLTKSVSNKNCHPFSQSFVCLLRGGASEFVKEPASNAGFNLALGEAGPDTLVVIDFGATWCGPCRSIAPAFEELAQAHQPIIEMTDGVKPPVIFIKADIEKLPEAARKYAIASLPTFVFLKQGEVVTQFSGADVAKLRETVDKLRV
mmetsp:Transcript_58/g.89  ORF Transcript_58/g.89 Transcript_58/m.89 type:complete len:172 (+) Transcript_58:46-561(+)